MFEGSDLAPSTLNQKLAHINALYVHVEELGGSLDDALSDMDLDKLGNLLESFFIKLRNVPNPNGSTLNRWNTAFHFVRATLMRLEKNGYPEYLVDLWVSWGGNNSPLHRIPWLICHSGH
ncbi:hypothetical protein GCM10007935_04220 [Hydrogenophaga electricum]|uniref:Uncharacterized protein n=1 Tax=Hydrogenophaga electricum TaxID=1230953 RepID=A0ABQ6BZS4_9BURK|nr:hypothetical protein GCM10007935_04220 [Hydrogenophaga electricum]